MTQRSHRPLSVLIASLVSIGSIVANAAGATPVVETVAQINNRGVELLRLGEPVAAYELLGRAAERSGELAAPRERARVLFNLGAALRQLGSEAEAKRYFLEALRLDPTFRAALDAVEELSRRSARGDDGQTFSRLLQLLIDEGNTVEAEAHIRDLLWRADPLTAGHPRLSCADLLILLAELLAAETPLPAEFESEWLRDIEGRQVCRDTESGERLAMLRRAFLGPLRTIADPQEGEALAAPWRDSSRHRRAFTRLLKAIGDRLQRRDQVHAAIPRLTLAWWTNDGGLETATHLAALLLNGDVDHRMALVDHLSTATRDPDRVPGPHNVSSRDRLGRLHVLLARLYAEQGQWGDRGAVLGSISHWERAVSLLGADPGDDAPSRDPTPAVFSGLADAYRSGGRLDDAGYAYLQAAEQYLIIERPVLARDALTKFHQVGDQHRFPDRLRDRAAQLRTQIDMPRK